MNVRPAAPSSCPPVNHKARLERWFLDLTPEQRGRVLSFEDKEGCKIIKQLFDKQKEEGRSLFYDVGEPLFSRQPLPHFGKLKARLKVPFIGRNKQSKQLSSFLEASLKENFCSRTLASYNDSFIYPQRFITADQQLEASVRLCDTREYLDTVTIDSDLLEDGKEFLDLMHVVTRARFLDTPCRVSWIGGTNSKAPRNEDVWEWEQPRWFGDMGFYSLGTYIAHKLEMALWMRYWDHYQVDPRKPVVKDGVVLPSRAPLYRFPQYLEGLLSKAYLIDFWKSRSSQERRKIVGSIKSVVQHVLMNCDSGVQGLYSSSQLDLSGGGENDKGRRGRKKVDDKALSPRVDYRKLLDKLVDLSSQEQHLNLLFSKDDWKTQTERAFITILYFSPLVRAGTSMDMVLRRIGISIASAYTEKLSMDLIVGEEAEKIKKAADSESRKPKKKKKPKGKKQDKREVKGSTDAKPSQPVAVVAAKASESVPSVPQQRPHLRLLEQQRMEVARTMAAAVFVEVLEQVAVALASEAREDRLPKEPSHAHQQPPAQEQHQSSEAASSTASPDDPSWASVVPKSKKKKHASADKALSLPAFHFGGASPIVRSSPTPSTRHVTVSVGPRASASPSMVKSASFGSLPTSPSASSPTSPLAKQVLFPDANASASASAPASTPGPSHTARHASFDADAGGVANRSSSVHRPRSSSASGFPLASAAAAASQAMPLNVRASAPSLGRSQTLFSPGQASAGQHRVWGMDLTPPARTRPSSTPPSPRPMPGPALAVPSGFPHQHGVQYWPVSASASFDAACLQDIAAASAAASHPALRADLLAGRADISSVRTDMLAVRADMSTAVRRHSLTPLSAAAGSAPVDLPVLAHSAELRRTPMKTAPARSVSLPVAVPALAPRSLSSSEASSMVSTPEGSPPRLGHFDFESYGPPQPQFAGRETCEFHSYSESHDLRRGCNCHRSVRVSGSLSPRSMKALEREAHLAAATSGLEAYPVCRMPSPALDLADADTRRPMLSNPVSRAPFVELDHAIASFVRGTVDFTEQVCRPAKDKLLRKISKLVLSLWPMAEVRVYGSFATTLCIPSSDLDLVICNIAAAASHSQSPLHALASALQQKKWLDELQVIETATVPVIKLKSVLKHSMVSIEADITFRDYHAFASVPLFVPFQGRSQHLGLQAAELVCSYLAAMPELKPLVLVLKQFLHERQLNNSYTGGLGSFSLVLMAIGFLQHSRRFHRNREFLQPPPLGSLLVGFFQLYGLRFDYQRMGISVLPLESHPGSDQLGPFFELHTSRFPPAPLVLVDPFNSLRNIAHSTFAMCRVKSAFREAFSELRARPELSRIIRGSDRLLA
eukprot:TRINITY_DN5043_c0_g1_i1.p1 TRINITY_DN5043_c0_g1~~TRINITY_DN5043_c0_g1_i1.p1  ORF type:complete len:1345 (+),score=190.37 TRINITY_DN5043_c0_g1_i1:216-4250(+)